MLIELEVSPETWAKIESIANANSRGIQSQLAKDFKYPVLKVGWYDRKGDEDGNSG